jgi:hypothetical protein
VFILGGITMDLTHIHLLLNHFPTIGYIIGGGLFLLSLITKSDHLKRRQPGCPAGNRSHRDPHLYERKWRAGRHQVPAGHIEIPDTKTHEGAALVAIGFMEFTGAFAWLGLWQFRRLTRVPSWNLAVILV